MSLNSKLTNRSWFWILQILGWGLPVSINTYAKLYLVPDLSRTYITLEGLTFAVAGIISTSIAKYFIDKKVNIERLSSKDFMYLILINVLCALLATIVIEVWAKFAYEYFEKEDLVRGVKDYFITLANFGIFIFLWITLLIAIKTFRTHQRSRIEQVKMESALKESQLNTLKGQINPHFMFNSLNNIRGLMLEDVPRSREMITKLSELLRYSLNSNKTNLVSLEQELTMVRNYIELSKIQLENRLEYQEEIKIKSQEIKVPPMIIQMIIENAIKHGVSNQVKGGLVFLKIIESDTHMDIEVSNTGKLVHSESSTHIGLQNILERLQLIYGKKATFRLTESDDKVLAAIKIPTL